MISRTDPRRGAPIIVAGRIHLGARGLQIELAFPLQSSRVVQTLDSNFLTTVFGSSGNTGGAEAAAPDINAFMLPFSKVVGEDPARTGRSATETVGRTDAHWKLEALQQMLPDAPAPVFERSAGRTLRAAA